MVITNTTTDEIAIATQFLHLKLSLEQVEEIRVKRRTITNAPIIAAMMIHKMLTISTSSILSSTINIRNDCGICQLLYIVSFNKPVLSGNIFYLPGIRFLFVQKDNNGHWRNAFVQW